MTKTSDTAMNTKRCVNGKGRERIIEKEAEGRREKRNEWMEYLGNAGGQAQRKIRSPWLRRKIRTHRKWHR